MITLENLKGRVTPSPSLIKGFKLFFKWLFEMCLLFVVLLISYLTVLAIHELRTLEVPMKKIQYYCTHPYSLEKIEIRSNSILVYCTNKEKDTRIGHLSFKRK